MAPDTRFLTVPRICIESNQTVFMITHDIDEAIYLADKIVLMTNGPGAVVAETVLNPLPRDRDRNTLHKHPRYYALRNHLIDFLVSRSKTFANDPANANHDRRTPPVIDPSGLEKPILAVDEPREPPAKRASA